jgi:hypothetical protein
MSWIQTQWDNKYIEDDKIKILKMGSRCYDIIPTKLFYKMEEYCENVTTEAETEQPASKDSQPGYMSLAAQYGLKDEMEIGGSTSSCHQATIEEEYLSYITAPLSPASMDILKFWEVSLWNQLQDQISNTLTI